MTDHRYKNGIFVGRNHLIQARRQRQEDILFSPALNGWAVVGWAEDFLQPGTYVDVYRHKCGAEMRRQRDENGGLSWFVDLEPDNPDGDVLSYDTQNVASITHDVLTRLGR